MRQSTKKKQNRNTGGRGRLSPEAQALMPRPDFPLRPHIPSNRWVKSIGGKRVGFGPLDDPDAALDEYLRGKEWWDAGQTPPHLLSGSGPLTVSEVRDLWLAARLEDAEDGTIRQTTFADYFKFTRDAADILGRSTPVSQLGPEQFRKLARKLREGYSPIQQNKRITVVKMMFGWAYDNDKIENPVKFGSDFKGATRREQRKAEAERGDLIYSAEEVRRFLAAATEGVKGEKWRPGGGYTKGVAPSKTLRAAILLGINGGFTQDEVAGLSLDEIDLERGLIVMLREKTFVRRVVPLWPETVAALRDALDERPKPSERQYARVALLTKLGNPWVRESVEEVTTAKGSEYKTHRTDALGGQFAKVAKACGVAKQGAGFGKLRHTHRTTTDGVLDQTAARVVMGQEPEGIDRHYVRNLGPDRLEEFLPRLRAVTEHVRGWLDFGD